MTEIYIKSSELPKVSRYSYSIAYNGSEILYKTKDFTDNDRANYKMLLLGVLSAANQCLEEGITEICVITHDSNIVEGINNRESKLKRAIKGEFVNSQEWIDLINCFMAFRLVESKIGAYRRLE